MIGKWLRQIRALFLSQTTVNFYAPVVFLGANGIRKWFGSWFGGADLAPMIGPPRRAQVRIRLLPGERQRLRQADPRVRSSWSQVIRELGRPQNPQK